MLVELTMFIEGSHSEEDEDGLVTVNTQPVMIDPTDVREFYTRKYGREGTRIVFRNGAARPVKESYAQVKEAFAAANRIN